jgi:putative NADPH-quinone reductase
MNRLLLNGSPRGAHSNSRLIIDWICEGFAEAGAEKPPVVDLARVNDRPAQREAFLAADEVVLVFPLYTDSTPGIVKAFLDTFAGADAPRIKGKRFGFVVHSGFPESAHSEGVADWLERLCDRLGMTFVGRAIKGGSEGFRIMPASMTRATRANFAAVGRSLSLAGKFDAAAVERLAHPRHFGRGIRALWAVLSIFGLPDFYWKMMLKKKGGWPRRFDQPYAEYVKPSL